MYRGVRSSNAERQTPRCTGALGRLTPTANIGAVAGTRVCTQVYSTRQCCVASGRAYARGFPSQQSRVVTSTEHARAAMRRSFIGNSYGPGKCTGPVPGLRACTSTPGPLQARVRAAPARFWPCGHTGVPPPRSRPCGHMGASPACNKPGGEGAPARSPPCKHAGAHWPVTSPVVRGARPVPRSVTCRHPPAHNKPGDDGSLARSLPCNMQVPTGR